MKTIFYLMGISMVFFMGTRKAGAQEQILTGQVLDLQDHQGLSGVTLITADTSSTTITDEDGHFRLKTQKQQGHLTVMMMGFKTREVPFGSRHRPLKIYLEKNKVSLNEVVIALCNRVKFHKDTLGSIASNDVNRIHQGDGTSLLAAFNSIPGVEMHQSSLSDSRVSILAIGFRSPWGIRDIKVYVN